MIQHYYSFSCKRYYKCVRFDLLRLTDVLWLWLFVFVFVFVKYWHKHYGVLYVGSILSWMCWLLLSQKLHRNTLETDLIRVAIPNRQNSNHQSHQDTGLYGINAIVWYLVHHLLHHISSSSHCCCRNHSSSCRVWIEMNECLLNANTLNNQLNPPGKHTYPPWSQLILQAWRGSGQEGGCLLKPREASLNHYPSAPPISEG